MTSQTKTEATKNREKVLAWLNKINATPDEIACCIQQCINDKDDRNYYLARAEGKIKKPLAI